MRAYSSHCLRQRGSPRTRSAGEGLDDVEPRVGIGALRDEAPVLSVPPPGGEQGKVEGRSVDALHGLGRSPGPGLVLVGELDAERLGRRVQSALHEGVVAGGHAQVGDVPQSVRGDWGKAESVADVLDGM